MPPLVELRCPRCGAAVPASNQTPECSYCGAALLRTDGAPGAGVDTHEVHGVRVELLGPSNVSRAVRILVACAGLAEEEARERLASLPTVIGEWPEWERAHDVCRQLVEGGAGATVATRIITIPHPPSADVVLEDAGPNLLETVMAFRRYVPVPLSDAKRIVESAPCVLAREMPGKKAHAFHDALVQAGAKARLE